MAANLAILRSQVESALAGRVAAPFTYRDRKIMETVSAGIRKSIRWQAACLAEASPKFAALPAPAAPAC